MEILPTAPDADYTGASRFYEFRCLMSSRYAAAFCTLPLSIHAVVGRMTVQNADAYMEPYTCSAIILVALRARRH